MRSLSAADPADRLELHELYARYCHAIDRNDAETVLALFAPGGGFHRTRDSAVFGPAASFTGDDGLRRYYTSRPTDRPANQHWVANLWFDDGGPTVIGHAAFQIIQHAGGRGEIVVFGDYIDELVPTGAGWRFLNRHVELAF